MYICYNFFVGDNMNSKKILFFDIDHTLYDPVNRTIPASTKEAFLKLSKQDDIILAIATGRAYYMLDIINDLKPFIDIYITINGQIIIHKDTIIHEAPLDNTTIQEVKTVLEQQNLTYGYVGKNKQVINTLTPYAKAMFKAASMPVPSEDDAYPKNNNIFQMWAFADDEAFKQIKAALKPYQLVPWLSDGFDVVLTNQSKKDGVKKVLDYLDIPLENAYAFGDGDNDKEMLAYVPNSIAMGNASNTIKSLAKHTTKRYDENGIMHAVKALNLLKE